MDDLAQEVGTEQGHRLWRRKLYALTNPLDEKLRLPIQLVVGIVSLHRVCKDIGDLDNHLATYPVDQLLAKSLKVGYQVGNDLCRYSPKPSST